MATPTAIKYRINWQSKTGATGHSEPIFNSRQAAQDIANQLNQQDKDIQLCHWVEAVPNEQATTDN